MARFTWALQLVLDTSMDLRKALPLALDATGNDATASWARSRQQHRPRHDAARGAGRDGRASRATCSTRSPWASSRACSPRRCSGSRSEYQQRAVAAIGILAQLLAASSGLLVAALIVVLIFRVFGGYVGTINKLAAIRTEGL